METNQEILHAAYRAYTGCSNLRARRVRCKRFTYGDQWADTYTDATGTIETEGQRSTRMGTQPLTNNVLRQLVRTVVGRYRSQMIDDVKPRNPTLTRVAAEQQLGELDSRAMEEFLISGCAVQRVEKLQSLEQPGLNVENVNINRFFIDSATDPRGNDCHLIGQLHDLTMAELLSRLAGGNRKQASFLRRVYTEQVDRRIAEFCTTIGVDMAWTGKGFWRAEGARCRAIEVWTLDSEEAIVCHNMRTGKVEVLPYTAKSWKELSKIDGKRIKWDVKMRWRCRWFAPTGELLAMYAAPAGVDTHPFVTKFFPLIDGEVHSFVEGAIDQQKYINRLVTMVNKAMESSAKGVLLFPETALPDGFTWKDVRQAWSNAGGILPYDPRESDARPEQIVNNGTNIGAYEMINLQMRLLEQVSGVSGALQGRTGLGGNSASLYEAQSQNSVIALTDLFDTFTAFREKREELLIKSLRV